MLLGHNGAGKSTTFSVISGATCISSGKVFICGENINDNLRACQQNIGFCPQYNPLFTKITVREHLKIYAKLKRGLVAPKNINCNLDQAIEKLAEEVQLKSKLDVVSNLLNLNILY